MSDLDYILNTLPSYLHDNDERFYLTASKDITGKWCLGYCSNDGRWLADSLVKEQVTLKGAVLAMRKLAKGVRG